MKIPVRTKIKVCFLVILGIFRGGVSFSQQFVGYGYDNYAGVNSLLFNPAMLAEAATQPPLEELIAEIENSEE